MTIAGTEWTYPLTAEQLEVYLNNPRSHSFNIVNEEQNATVGHAEILLNDDGTCKIDKLIIGDPAHRGKGLCQQVMKELVPFAFTRLPVHTVELNVFDWNSSAIRCYEKVGFKFNPEKSQTLEIDDEVDSLKHVNTEVELGQGSVLAPAWSHSFRECVR